MKVTGKGALPGQPVIVKARYFSKEAETKIKDRDVPCEAKGKFKKCNQTIILWTFVNLAQMGLKCSPNGPQPSPQMVPG